MADLQPDSILTDFAADFNSLDPSFKQNQLPQLLEKIKSSLSDRLQPNLTAYAVYLLAGSSPIKDVIPTEPLSIIALRPLLTHFITTITTLSAQSDLQITLATTTISLLSPRVVSFEDADTSLKRLLADAHQSQEDFQQSARALESINLTTTQRQVTDTEKSQTWIRIARCYLEEDDPVSATAYINRAKNVLHNLDLTTAEGRETRLHFQSAQARIRDSQRDFLAAASSYHLLSFETLIDEDDRLQSLTAAINCGVLAPAGPERARTLARLYKDERAAQLPEFPILEKIFLDRVLEPEEVKAFADKLQPHQVARTADGSTVLERAVLEHNLLGASRLYWNISVSGLGELLGTDGDRAMAAAAGMIEQRRLRGWIDQVDGVVLFEGVDVGAETQQEKRRDEDEGLEREKLLGAGTSELRRWDAAVQGLLAEVEGVTTMVQTRDPVFYAAHMAV